MTAYLLSDVSQALAVFRQSDPAARHGNNQPATDEPQATTDVARLVDLDAVHAKEPDWQGQWGVLKFL